MSRPRVLALLLGLLTLLVYLPVWRCDYVDFDDDQYVTNNPMVREGLTVAGIRQAFTQSIAVNWHPVTWLSHMADTEIFGLNPHPAHLVNAVFHAANAALLLGLMFRLTRRLWPAAMVAALFAWHPLHVESVAWISERKDVLSLFFGLLALLSYVNYAQGKSSVNGRGRHFRRADYGLALLFFALALMSKAMMVTLPCLMLLLDYWPLGRIQLGAAANRDAGAAAPVAIVRLLLEKWPFFLLVAASCVVTYLAESAGHLGQANVQSLKQVPLVNRLENVPVAYATYLLKIFWPANLAVFYPLAPVIPAGRVIGTLVILVIVSIIVWIRRQSRPYLAVGWLWFLGTLVPVIGLVQVGGDAWADRYSYLPSVGIFIMFVFTVAEGGDQRTSLRKAFPVTSAIILLVCIGLTERQLSFWRDSGTLFRHALAATKDNFTARNDLAYFLQQQGQLPEALAEYRAGAAIAPRSAIAHNNLASCLELNGRSAEALEEFRKAIELAPNDASQHTGAGFELGVLGQFEAALQEFATAEKLAPGYPPPHMHAAVVLFKMGRSADGIGELRAAVQLAPNDWQTLIKAARFLASNDDPAGRDGTSAMKLAAKANILTGGSIATVCDVLGMAFCAEAGAFEDAEASVQHAIELATTSSTNVPAPLQQRLELYRQHKPWRESFRIAAPIP